MKHINRKKQSDQSATEEFIADDELLKLEEIDTLADEHIRSENVDELYEQSMCEYSFYKNDLEMNKDAKNKFWSWINGEKNNNDLNEELFFYFLGLINTDRMMLEKEAAARKKIYTIPLEGFEEKQEYACFCMMCSKISFMKDQGDLQCGNCGDKKIIFAYKINWQPIVDEKTSND